MARLLMAPPVHYDVVYEINPWMHRQIRADRERAAAQWAGLHRVLTEEMGAEVLLVEPEAGLPDLVFTANAGLVDGDRVLLSRFRHPERGGEEAVFARWFEAHGLTVCRPPGEVRFEGEGDALWLGDTLFAGYHFRSDAVAHAWLAETLGARVLPLRLTDPRYYHLDTCFCPLDERTAAYYPGAFDEYALRVIQANVPARVIVREEEAARFACNAVALGRRVALNTGCPQFEGQLRALGFHPHATPLDEFIKAGGSAKCLTLHLDRPASRRPPVT